MRSGPARKPGRSRRRRKSPSDLSTIIDSLQPTLERLRQNRLTRLAQNHFASQRSDPDLATGRFGRDQDIVRNNLTTGSQGSCSDG
jgi:hypothetical protein